MKLGIIGLPQTGKKLLYELLTGVEINPASVDRQKPVAGVAEIKDTRFNALAAMYQPKKEVRARIDMNLLPGFETGSQTAQDLFRDIADVDALCHVVRAFNDSSVYHVNGSVNPARDIENVNSELILHDLIFIEKRMERIGKERKAKDEKRLHEEEALLAKFREHLEADKPLRTFGQISEEDSRIIASYPFLTRKPVLAVLNVSDPSEIQTIMEPLKDLAEKSAIDIMAVPVKLEGEIAQLDESEQKEFMADAGITESALVLLSSLAMKSLGLMSFFTVGKDEVRQWLIRLNSTAPVAAGAVHTDIQRGFIRAEVMKYSDLIELGSEEAVKKAGKLYVNGKDYIVEDGDIINFRFNI